jgi:hypothetical protein
LNECRARIRGESGGIGIEENVTACPVKTGNYFGQTRVKGTLSTHVHSHERAKGSHFFRYPFG